MNKKVIIGIVVVAVLLLVAFLVIFIMGQFGSLQEVPLSFSMTETNPAACDHANPPEQKDACLSTVAFNLKDITACDRLSSTEQKDMCISRIAFALQNATICEKVTDAAAKSQCIDGTKP